MITLSKLGKIIYGAFGVPLRSRPRAGGGGGVRSRDPARVRNSWHTLQKNSSIHTAPQKTGLRRDPVSTIRKTTVCGIVKELNKKPPKLGIYWL